MPHLLGNPDEKDPHMDADELSGKFFEFRTDLERSLRYYAVMRARCELWAFAVQALCILTSASFFAAAVCDISPRLMKCLAFAASACLSLSLAERVSRRADWYLQKRRDFSELAGLVPLDEGAFTVALLEGLKRRRLELEADEPPVYGCLSVLCHNEECEAVGRPECKAPLTWWQRNVLRFLPVSYATPRSALDAKSDADCAEDGDKHDDA